MSSWIKVRSHLSTHPHVVRIASALCLPCVHVLGALVHVWSVADLHADGEKLCGMTMDSLDKLTETPGLAQQLVACGWLKVLEDGLQLVNYKAHNGANAKRRALDSERKKTVRMTSASCLQNVRKTAQNVRPKSKSKNKSNTTSSFHSEVVTAEPVATDSTATPAEPPVMTYPCQGKADGWHLSVRQIADWQASYPGLNVEGECRKALAWLNANPTKRRAYSNMPRFLVNWFNRATDRPAPAPPRPVYAAKPATPTVTERMGNAKVLEELFGQKAAPVPPTTPTLELEVRRG